MEDYSLYNRMVDLTSEEVETSEATVLLGLNQEQADEYEKLLQGVIEERKKIPDFPGYAHMAEDGSFYDCGYDLD